MSSSRNCDTALLGKVEKILFQNPQNGYTVLHLQSQDKQIGKAIVVGHFAHSFLGDIVSFQGAWQDHPKHGAQFFAKSFVIEKTDPHFAARKLLTSHLEGIGPSYAKKLQDAFGDELPEILEHTPQRLREIPGIGKERYKKIIQSWQKHRHSYEIMLFLVSHHIGYALASKVYKKHGNQTIERVSENPYRLVEEIEGIGFQTADNIAKALDIAQDSPQRLQAGMLYTVQLATKQGHCGVDKAKLIWQSAQLLNVSQDLVLAELPAMVETKRLIEESIKDSPALFMPSLWQQERLIADKLKAILALKKPSNIVTLLKTLKQEIQKEKLELSSEQSDAITQAIQANVFVLTGGPGVGKTTLVRLLVKVFSQNKLKVALAAPTGRAAKRLSEVTSVNAKTIHRLLEYDPFTNRFTFDAEYPLPFDVLILDEVSMLDVPLCAAVMQALSLKTRIIMVGDVDQLSSVGPGDILRSMIVSEKVPCYLLKTIFRQKATSQIIINAHRVNEGLMPLVPDGQESDFYWVGAPSVEEQQRRILTIVATRLSARFGFNVMDDIQVLTPMNDGKLGVNTLNTLLQKTLNPANDSKIEINHRDGVLREGDKVIQIVNNYEKNVFNGDLGRVSTLDLRAKKMTVMFEEQKIEYQFKELEQLRLAYAISVHKSQGSEYPAVVVVLSMQQKMMLKRNLLYTAITRGKSCVVVVCEKSALQCAIDTNIVASRMNKLEEWLKDE